jgi:hypothetical protein
VTYVTFFRNNKKKSHKILRKSKQILDIQWKIQSSPVALLAVLGEIQVPLSDALHGGVASGGEGAEQVESGGRLRVGPDHPLRVRDAALLVERVAVDVVAPVARQLHPVLHLERLRPRLRELTGHPTNLLAHQSNRFRVCSERRTDEKHLLKKTECSGDLDDGRLGAKHEDGGHLEEDAEGVADVDAVELLEALGAVAALEEEGAAHGGLGEALLEAPRLPREHDRRERLDRVEHALQLRRVRVLGLLQRLLRPPALHRPLPRRGRRLPLRRQSRRRGLRRRRHGVLPLRRIRGVDRADGEAPQGEEGRQTAALSSGDGGSGGRGVGDERHCGGYWRRRSVRCLLGRKRARRGALIGGRSREASAEAGQGLVDLRDGLWRGCWRL